MAQDGAVEYAAFEDHARPEHAEQIFERGAAFARAAIMEAVRAPAA